MVLILFVGFPILAQKEVHRPPAVLSAVGSSDGSPISLSRCRLSMVHVITLPAAPVAVDDVLYIRTDKHLYAFRDQ